MQHRTGRPSGSVWRGISVWPLPVRLGVLRGVGGRRGDDGRLCPARPEAVGVPR
jgi:hypothetical protein